VVEVAIRDLLCPGFHLIRYTPPLKGKLALVERRGVLLPQWQIEVTGGGRIWYLLDELNKTVWVRYAGTGHPKATD
jgi:hypothetical protein